MSRDLSNDTIVSINEDVVYPFFATELKFDGNNVLRMWTGQGTLVLADGTQWVGLGNLLNISTIELLVENKLVDLERARVARFTSGYQKSIYAGDLGLDFVEDLQDKQIPWGRKIDN